jgi:hypothetical protein
MTTSTLTFVRDAPLDVICADVPLPEGRAVVEFEVAPGFIQWSDHPNVPAVRVTPRHGAITYPAFYADAHPPTVLLMVASWRAPDRFVLARLLEARAELAALEAEHMSSRAWYALQRVRASLEAAVAPSDPAVSDGMDGTPPPNERVSEPPPGSADELAGALDLLDEIGGASDAPGDPAQERAARPARRSRPRDGAARK